MFLTFAINGEYDNKPYITQNGFGKPATIEQLDELLEVILLTKLEIRKNPDYLIDINKAYDNYVFEQIESSRYLKNK